MGNVTVDKKTALKQVDTLFNRYDIDTEFMVGQAQLATEQVRLNLAKAVARGRLSIESQEGKGICMVQRITVGKHAGELYTFREFDYEASQEIASYDGNDKIACVLDALGDKGCPPRSEMDPLDLSVSESIANIFLSL